MDVTPALLYLQQHRNLVLPHGLLPGSYPGGIDADFDEARWMAYQWNPPVGYPGLPEDSAASAKPLWVTLVSADRLAQLADRREVHLALLRREAEKRIVWAYGESTLTDEFALRLRGGHTPAQDTERDRIRAKYQQLRAWVLDPARTVEELTDPARFDPREDSLWEEDGG